MSLPDILEAIVRRRRARYSSSATRALSLPSTEGLSVAAREHGENPFSAALAARRGRAVIAEVKVGSPRLGDLRDRIDPERQARSYARAGAAALSVVVEPDFFFGSYELLTRCKEASGLSAIAKDFVVSERQLDAARDAGADAVLLIAALYSASELRDWAGAARIRSLVPLVETHDEEEIARLCGDDWELVGVNNRDLRTFDVDLERSIRFLPKLPGGALKVAESGIATRHDVERLAGAGFDAFLIGESLLLAEDPEAKLRELVE